MKSHVWNHMFEITWLKSHGWNHMVEITCLKSHVWNHMFEITCLKSHGWNHMFEITWLKSHVWNQKYLNIFWFTCHCCLTVLVVGRVAALFFTAGRLTLTYSIPKFTKSYYNADKQWLENLPIMCNLIMIMSPTNFRII